MLNWFDTQPGQHVVIVRYTSARPNSKEWVYNLADIDSTKVVWARDMGREANAELLNYFKGRRIWLLEPEQSPPKLSPYPLD